MCITQILANKCYTWNSDIKEANFDSLPPNGISWFYNINWSRVGIMILTLHCTQNFVNNCCGTMPMLLSLFTVIGAPLAALLWELLLVKIKVTEICRKKSAWYPAISSILKKYDYKYRLNFTLFYLFTSFPEFSSKLSCMFTLWQFLTKACHLLGQLKKGIKVYGLC